ncbi:RDD family protein [Ornithinibacillus scapharcae]|uniref:RDD family protein n=1 Tax=Ornithinibacillus scapharcae TaxID=1147159 RepID=UPI000225B3F4|nr:RDD family protein [Ornithinibacillus scapharcae]
MLSGDNIHFIDDEEGSVYASFWQRLAAWLIDTALVLLSLFFIGFIPDGAMAINSLLFDSRPIDEYVTNYWVIQIAIVIFSFSLYYALMESFGTQGTVGKMILKIKVVNEDGEKISFSHALGRFFLQLASLCLLGIGHLFAVFTENRQTVHDMISKSEVVRR